MLVKLQASGYGREEVKRCADIFRGQIVDVTATLYTVQLAGTSDKLDAFLSAVREVAEIVECRAATKSCAERGLAVNNRGAAWLRPLFSVFLPDCWHLSAKAVARQCFLLLDRRGWIE